MSPLKHLNVAAMVRCDSKDKKDKDAGVSPAATPTASTPSSVTTDLDKLALDNTTSATSTTRGDSLHTASTPSRTVSHSTTDSVSSATTARSCSASAASAAVSALKRPISTLIKKTVSDKPKDPSASFDIRGPQPACQLFSVFKALAAGNPDEDADDEETESESETKTAGTSTVYTDATAKRADGASSFGTLGPLAEAATRRASIAAADVDAAMAATREDDKAAADAADAAGSSGSEAVKRWLRDTVSNNETMGQRFAAVSVSNLSPLTAQDMEDIEIQTNAHMSPLLQKPLLEGEEADEAEEDENEEFYPADDFTAPITDVVDATLKSTSGTGGAGGLLSRAEMLARFRRDNIPPDEKLAVIIDEFGDIADKFVNEDGLSEPERLLAESQGSLFKSIMMIGNLHLTTHRLLFHALLPPDNLYDHTPSAPPQTEAEGNAKADRPDVIIAGSVVMHRNSPLKPRKRVWMELGPDMLTAYPSATDASRVRPLYSILLSSALKLLPFDETQPLDFYMTYSAEDGERTIHFTVDNETSAIRWRRHFEDVLFRHARDRFRKAHCRDAVAASDGQLTEAACESAGESQWALVRCCVPLNRALIKGLGEYHSFATLVNLEISLDQSDNTGFFTENPLGAPVDMSKTTPLKHIGTPSSSGSISPSGGNTPTRSRSLRQSLPSFKRQSRDVTPRETSRERSPLAINTATASEYKEGDRLPSPTYLHTYIPAHLKRLQPERKIKDKAKDGSSDLEDIPAKLEFLMAVLNDQSWFADALRSAVHEAHKRHYKPGAVPAKMLLDVGGYDCLAGDDEHDADESSLDSDRMEEDEDDEHGKPRVVVEARKAEKAAMAARVFGLRMDEGVWLKRCYVQHNLLPARGHIIVNPRFICFWRRAKVGSDIRYRFSTRDVKSAQVAPPIRAGLHGFVLKVQGHHDVHFEMFNKAGRDEVIRRINDLCANVHPPTPGAGTPPTPSRSATTDSAQTASSITTGTDISSVPSTPTTSTAGERWRTAVKDMMDTPPDLQINPAVVKSGGDETIKQAAEILAPPPDMLLYPPSMSELELNWMPFMANRPWATRVGWNVRLTPRTFTMLTIGSRGDVQPYIALGVRLMEDGHKVIIVTHDEFKKWIEGYGIEHRQAGGDPTALMKLSTEHRMFSPGFFKEALGGFRAWLDQLLLDAWTACHDADVLIESPSAMAGVHIAEALKIPYFRAFTMPWTRTAAYPQAFMVPAFEMGPSFNYSTYVLFDSIMWRASSSQINRWRQKTLGLGATDQTSLSISKVPFLYNFSPAVVPKPLDWYDDITITGYWNLENSDMDWTPPESLIKWMDKAKADNKPIVYIGFGSIVVPDPAAVTKSIIEGVEKAGVCAIVAKGWSARDSKATDDVQFPESCYPLDKVPHGWLFPKIQAAMHHGGAGTTGASLRSGIPTLIKPWFGDQHFWALRVTKLGAGMKVASLRVDDIAAALKKATTNTVMIEKAARIGERIRQENGVDTAVHAIHFNLVRAAKDRITLKKEDNKLRTESGATPSAFPNLSGLPSIPGITAPSAIKS